MHGPNRTHNTKDCFELKRRAKRAKADTTRGGADKVTYKDLKAFVNAKVNNSSKEESNHKVNTLANASGDDSNSGASRVDRKESNSNNE
eukprot:5756151-Ditylum_brightwellii.AAC.1